mgnify:CR=1 FL=1
MRKTYLISYDITDTKRRTSVFRALRGRGDHLQFSVFRCDLSEADLVEVKDELRDLIHHTVDQVLIVDLGPADGRALTCFEALGKGVPAAMRDAIVV